jgi:aspartyl-tRNA(Asn)/glutamyl-tRNA(Gln) amidotransferase subunit A
MVEFGKDVYPLEHSFFPLVEKGDLTQNQPISCMEGINMMDTPLPFCTITELAGQIRSGALSPVQLTEQLLARIKQLDGQLNAFRVVAQERALAEARAAEAALNRGHDLGLLHGVPYVAKDLFDVKGLPTSAGTHLLEGNVARADCTVVQRLSQAGMILLGKTNTVQFALGGVGINHDHGTPHNPWHLTAHVPGGSSSGTAVAVAAGLAPMGLGSDTGGSVRVPAALCGTVGLKTTVGRISRAGVYPLSWALDSVGPLTRTVEDAAMVYQVLQGVDVKDGSTMEVPPHDVLQGYVDGVKGLRIAFGETVFFDDVDAEIEQAVREAGRVLQSLGAHVDSMAVPEAAEVRASEKRALMVPAEACVVNGKLLDDHFDELDPVVSHRMIAGRKLSAPDYIAQRRQWMVLRANVLHALRDVEALIVPTTMIPARPLEVCDASMDSYMEHHTKYLRNTNIGNVLNLCAVSVPCGITSQGLPIGLMIYAKPFQEELALRVAYAYEQATDWGKRHPDLAWAE